MRTPSLSCLSVPLRGKPATFGPLRCRSNPPLRFRIWRVGHHLLVIVVGVRAVVEGADERRVIRRSGGDVAEVVADKGVVVVRRGTRVWAIQLRIPGVGG